MNMATAAISGFTPEDAAAWAKNAHANPAARNEADYAKQMEEIEKLFEGNEGIVQNQPRGNKHQQQNRHKSHRRK
jgi:hypothetical protein